MFLPFLRLCLFACAILTCIGCDLLPTEITRPSGPSATATSIALPTLEESGDDSGLALIEGVVRAEPSARCVWLETTDGREISLAWPRGYTATFDPLTVFDDAGSVVIRGSSSVEFGGMTIADYKLPSRPPTCSHGTTVFAISDVVSVTTMVESKIP